MFQLLIEYNSDLDDLDINLKPPLFYAIQQENVKIVKHLLCANCSPWSCKDTDYMSLT